MSVTIQLLGGFEVRLNGGPVPESAWTRRHAALLVKLLAISPGRRRHREQVIDMLWPGLALDVAGPRLHKAAHFARRALGDTPDCLVLRSDLVALLPDVDVRVDALEFQQLGEAARGAGTPAAAADALRAWHGAFLPDDLYDEWAEETRESLRLLHLDLLRQAGRWEDLLQEEPGDEEAHLALIGARLERGDVRGAQRQLERMDQALRRGLGIVPSPEVERLRAELQARVAGETGTSTTRPVVPAQRESSGRRLYGRKDVGDQLRQAMDRADTGRGGAVLVSGPPGVGKTALLDLFMALAAERGWRTGRGTASAVEGPWPYAPVLEALSDLCRQHPALLDGLDDAYRSELERGLSGRDVSWSGESGHQRFFVAAAELVRLAATGHGLLLGVDDVHEADQGSLRLLHYLSRVAINEPVLVALTHRPKPGAAASEMLDSLATRGLGTRIDVEPLSHSAARRLLADTFPDLDDAVAEEIWTVSAGLPFTVLELARAGSTRGGVGPLPALPGPVLRTFQRTALLGTTFTTDELLAISGVDEDESYRHLEAGLAALLIEPDPAGFRYRHALLRDALLTAMPPSAVAAARREVAEQLVMLDAAPARIAHQFLGAGLPSRAVPFVVRAVDTAGALGAYRDALTLVDAVRAHAGPDDLPRLLARRGDLLMALGDPEAVSAYREAVSVTTGIDHRLVRARLARAASFVHDLDTARAALAGLEPEDDAADGPILLARGNLAYFDGDIETAWSVAGQARELLQDAADPWQLVDLVSLQGLIAHQRGEWFERFRLELRRTQGRQRLATALFDAHLCVAEYLLYGPVPYAEVIRDAEELRQRASQAGALRGVAFANALIGEAALLNGDLELAERELVGAVDLHREIDAPAGEAHSLQRLAETRLAQGDREEAQRLLNQALPLAHYSAISLHLLQRIYGTMIEAAPDPEAARAVVERAESAMGETDRCTFCVIMLAVPAAIACADVGDVVNARRHLEVAQESAARWSGSSWQAAVLEARAHLARAEGNESEFRRLLGEAEQTYIAAGHPLDADRCARTATAQARRPSVELPG